MCCCQCYKDWEQTPEAKAKKATRSKKQSYKAKRAELAKTPQAVATRKKRMLAYNASAKAKASKAEWHIKNINSVKSWRAEYYRANPHLKNVNTAKRRAQKLQATPPWADTAAIKAIYEQASFMSKVLGEKQHVDHIIPLQGKKVCGLHVAANLQILSATDNLKKSNKLLPMYEMLKPAVE
jgi:hypothetical protein